MPAPISHDTVVETTVEQHERQFQEVASYGDEPVTNSLQEPAASRQPLNDSSVPSTAPEEYYLPSELGEDADDQRSAYVDAREGDLVECAAAVGLSADATGPPPPPMTTTTGGLLRRLKKGNLKGSSGDSGLGRNKSRRVSFDPLALLLDASLEGELDLVKKTALEVANPSAANDEGITALHNAICAGHLEIVRFLVELGCDVNAQDSDGWYQYNKQRH